MSTKLTGLPLGLIKKGAAAPTTPASQAPAPEPQPVVEVPDAGQAASRAPRGQQYFKALTLKLDEKRYMALKMKGLRSGRTSQEILVEALDLWFEKGSLQETEFKAR
jgi:hypothetical protein